MTLPVGNRYLKFTSTGIHYDIIGVLTDSVQRNVTCDIKYASFYFYSSLVHTDQVIAIADQLSQVVRYVCIVENENGNPKSIQTNESFLSFIVDTDQFAADQGGKIVD
jgi:hypothetical protein